MDQGMAGLVQGDDAGAALARPHGPVEAVSRPVDRRLVQVLEQAMGTERLESKEITLKALKDLNDSVHVENQNMIASLHLSSTNDPNNKQIAQATIRIDTLLNSIKKPLMSKIRPFRILMSPTQLAGVYYHK